MKRNVTFRRDASTGHKTILEDAAWPQELDITDEFLAQLPPEVTLSDGQLKLEVSNAKATYLLQGPSGELGVSRFGLIAGSRWDL